MYKVLLPDETTIEFETIEQVKELVKEIENHNAMLEKEGKKDMKIKYETFLKKN